MSGRLILELSEIKISRVKSMCPVTIIPSHIKCNDYNKNEKEEWEMSVKVLVNYSYVKEILVSYVSFGLDDVMYFENNLLINLVSHYYG
jgi:hypothetical protein